jgi:GNAT superfamily N-acetyltransferase
MLEAWSREALVREVMEAPRRALRQSAGMIVIERPGWWQLITPSFKQGGFNEVALSVLDARDADATIDDTIEQYRRMGLRFRWTVGPDSRPQDLAARLSRRGMFRHELRGMVRDCRGLAARGGAARRITTERVDAATEPEYRRVAAIGWEMDPTPLGTYHTSVLADPTQSTQLFLARYGGVAAATGSFSSDGRTAHLIGGVVLPAYRGRGLYRAVVGARLEAGAERGLELATSHAGPMSAPALERLGFVAVCDFSTFVYSPD